MKVIKLRGTHSPANQSLVVSEKNETREFQRVLCGLFLPTEGDKIRNSRHPPPEESLGLQVGVRVDKVQEGRGPGPVCPHGETQLRSVAVALDGWWALWHRSVL